MADPHDGSFLEVNGAWTRLLGWTRDELLGSCLGDFVHPEDRVRVAEIGRVAAQPGKEAPSVVLRLRHADGGHRSVDWRCSIAPGLGVRFGMGRDVTDLEEEREVRERRIHLLHRSMALASAGQFELDLRTGIWSSSAHLDRIFGIGPEFERTIGGWVTLLHPDDRDAMDRALTRALKPGAEPFDHRYRIIQPNTGATLWTRGYGEVQLTPDDEPVLFYGLIQDISQEVRRTTEVHDQRARLETIIAGARLGTWEWDIGTGDTTFNERWAEMLGYTLDEVEPNVATWAKLLHPDDADAVQHALTDHLEGKTPFYSTTHRVIHKSGKSVWIQDVGRVLEWDADGSPSFAAGIHLDVSEQMQAEEEARENLAKFEALFESHLMGVTVTDEAGHVLEANATAEEILGLGRRDHRGRGVRDDAWEVYRTDGTRMPPEEFPAVRAQAESRTVIGVEMGVRRPDGEIRWISASATPVDHPGIGVIVTYTDITKTRMQELRYRAIFDAVEEVVFTLDAQQRHTGVYGSWVERTGATPETFLGRTSEEIFGPEARVHTEANQRALAGERVSYDWSLPGERGEQQFHTVLTPLRDQSGTIYGIVGVARDVTRRVKLEEARLQMKEQVVELQKARSLAALAGGVAHDFNNILMGVMANAELASDLVGPASPVHGMLSGILESANRAADLSKQMLAYSGKGRFFVQPLDANAVLRGIEPLLRAAVDPTLTLAFDLADDAGRIEADASQIRQVVHSVVVNAAEAMEGGAGTVTVATRIVEWLPSHAASRGDTSRLQEGRFLEICVRDEGCGMDSEAAARAFEPFFSTKFTGRGLGLAAAEGIMKGHQGAIILEDAPGGGTLARLLFPLMPAASPESKPAPQSVVATPSAPLVLLADDEEMVRRVTQRMLERMGYQVITASDGLEALALFDARPSEIHLVILDMMMPRLGGLSTLEQLRTRSPNLPVLMVSGYNEQDTINRLQGKGPQDFIQKPFRMNTLKEKVEELLG